MIWLMSFARLTFTSTSIAGKKMIVQATNTGSDVGEGQFDLAMPGGGVGQFNGCDTEWGAPSGGWGQQYGGEIPYLGLVLKWRDTDCFQASQPTLAPASRKLSSQAAISASGIGLRVRIILLLIINKLLARLS